MLVKAHYFMTPCVGPKIRTDLAAQDLINWAKDTYAPEEMIWATLLRREGAPGSKSIKLLSFGLYNL